MVGPGLEPMTVCLAAQPRNHKRLSKGETPRGSASSRPKRTDEEAVWSGFCGRKDEEIRNSWRCAMPPRGVKSAKRKRQYEHIKRSESARGRSNKVAERIAAATTNKTRREKGETK